MPYHISPKTGEPGRCVGADRCLFKTENGGAGVVHFGTMEEANEYYSQELAKTNKNFSSLSKSVRGSNHAVPKIKATGASSVVLKKLSGASTESLAKGFSLVQGKVRSWVNTDYGREALRKGVEATPTGVFLPARLDDNGNVVKPALTMQSFYDGINRKHFLKENASVEEVDSYVKSPGSQFDVSVSNIQELAGLTAMKNGGSFEGEDDVEKLVSMGAYRDSFKPGYKYFMTPVGGRLGVTTSVGLSDDTEIDFYEKIPGSNICSLTIKQDKKPDVDFGVLIVKKQGDFIHQSDSGSPDDYAVITAHPGMPSVPNPIRDGMTREQKDAYDAKEHELFKKLKAEGRLTVGEIRKYKGRDFNLNIVQK